MNNKFEIDSFLYQFFKASGCEVSKKEQGIIHVSLTEEIDQAIMNRPFYWHYIKKMGHKGEPYQLTFVTDINKQETNGEWIHIGTPRMNDIYRYMEQKCTYIKLYEQITTETQTMLQPWFIVNMIITFKGRQLKEEVISIGINLINGRFLENAMEKLESTSLSSFIGDNCYKISPLIKITSGFQRIKRRLYDTLQHFNYRWVIESIIALKKELLLLIHFYDETEHMEEMIKEALEIISRLQPEIHFQVINGGIFYLSEHWNNIKS